MRRATQHLPELVEAIRNPAAAIRGRVGPLAAGLLAAALLVAAPSGSSSLAAQDLAITNVRVLPASGATIDDATVLVRDGVIREVGAAVEVPDGVRRIDGGGGTVTPGLFDTGTRMGLVEVGAVDDTRDYAVSDDAIAPAFDVAAGINPNSTLIPINRLGGVTTVLAAPASGLISGQGAVIDLAGESLDAMMVRRGAAMIATFGAEGAEDVGDARGAAAGMLRQVLEDARFWSENREAFDEGSTRDLSVSLADLRALQPVLAGEVPFVVRADRASDIAAMLDLAEAFGLDLVVAGGTEAWMLADRLAAADVPVVVDPVANLLLDFERLGARFENAALLERAGVRVVLSTFDTHNVRGLRWAVGNAIRFGLPRDVALRAVTLNPAEVFGVADRYGSLEPGKVANLVVWSGDPFELSTRPEAVVIRGEVVPEASRQRELLERYRDLERSLPPAYPEGGDGR